MEIYLRQSNLRKAKILKNGINHRPLYKKFKIINCVEILWDSENVSTNYKEMMLIKLSKKLKMMQPDSNLMG